MHWELIGASLLGAMPNCHVSLKGSHSKLTLIYCHWAVAKHY